MVLNGLRLLKNLLLKIKMASSPNEGAKAAVYLNEDTATLFDFFRYPSKIVAQTINSKKSNIKTIKEFVNTIFGVEIELENVSDPDNWIIPNLMWKEDGSLRNNGKEFVTDPLPFNQLKEILLRFYNKNGINQHNVSERCSVHVHVNCQEMNKGQLITFIKIYQVFEKLLFAWIGDHRDKGIFCVPLSETCISHRMFEKIKMVDLIYKFKRWQKYTAFNLLPLVNTFGTIEFRHMGGQSHPEKLIQWLRIIGNMYEFSLKNTGADFDNFMLSLNTTSHYNILLNNVFGQDVTLFKEFTPLQEYLEEGILNLKYMLLNDDAKKVTFAEDFFVLEDTAQTYR